jgi:hypothetical protein
MAELTDKDRANLYKMAQGIEAKLVKQGYKKGTAEFKTAFTRATKSIGVASRSISETGRANRASRATVKGTGRPASKPAPSTGGRGASPDRPVRRRGASTSAGNTGSAGSGRSRESTGGGAVVAGGAMIGAAAAASRAAARLRVTRAIAQNAALRSGRSMSQLPLRYQQVAAGVRSTTRPQPSRGNAPAGRGRGTGATAGGNAGGGGGRGARGGGPTKKGR